MYVLLRVQVFMYTCIMMIIMIMRIVRIIMGIWSAYSLPVKPKAHTYSETVIRNQIMIIIMKI